nr:immunoglobulin heavy chain junction region [Macaca mulatta]
CSRDVDPGAMNYGLDSW